jgi:hypothetical protein
MAAKSRSSFSGAFVEVLNEEILQNYDILEMLA